MKPYIGKIVLALDWEADAVKLGTAWAKRWLDYIYKETGIRAFIYMSKGVASSPAWAEVAKNHPLWMAQYANYEKQYGYNADPWGAKTCGKWGNNIAIRQYTSQGYLDGWKKNLDLDLAYIDKAEWERLCGKAAEPDTPEKPVSTDRTINVTETAREVIAGKYGNGIIRRNKLGKLFADAVQGEVNRIMGG